MKSSCTHPGWSLARLAIYMIALTVTLYLNASRFDITELKSILTMFFVAAGSEAFLRGRVDG